MPRVTRVGQPSQSTVRKLNTCTAPGISPSGAVFTSGDGGRQGRRSGLVRPPAAGWQQVGAPRRARDEEGDGRTHARGHLE
ncbi:hypothetical protein FRAAL4028 [Frankia alni ACN14a]|uniref:Uncharacterized protein n=1 Tax=Frankia alni (strain DSM 45986 / CECT 9034 / ACN14a) TaxID=326424 RepID=Q0RIJ8_FRAAA|nr:hypothetical protein FRAAL4028 [Frankia alni ACN14a]